MKNEIQMRQSGSTSIPTEKTLANRLISHYNLFSKVIKDYEGGITNTNTRRELICNALLNFMSLQSKDHFEHSILSSYSSESD